MGERVAMVGSRNYPDLTEVFSYVCSLAPDTVVVSGGARGVDQTAEGASRARGLTVVSYRPTKLDGVWRISRWTYLAGDNGPAAVWFPERFNTFPQAAYFRNGLIVDAADRVEAFWSGESPGTRNTIALAEKAGKLGTVHGASLTRT